MLDENHPFLLSLSDEARTALFVDMEVLMRYYQVQALEKIEKRMVASLPQHPPKDLVEAVGPIVEDFSGLIKKMKIDLGWIDITSS